MFTKDVVPVVGKVKGIIKKYYSCTFAFEKITLRFQWYILFVKKF